MKVGDAIPITPYGTAILCYYRELDCTYVLDLPFGKLYAHRETIRAATTTTTTKMTSMMKLNEAYEALEKMRLLNLEVSCQERGIPFCLETTSCGVVAAHQCTTCLLLTTTATTPPPEKQPFQQQQHVRFPRFLLTTAPAVETVDEQQANSNRVGFSRLNHFVKTMQNNSNIKKGDPCLLCGSPVCSSHASKTFRREANIDVCLSCEGIFGMDFVLDCLTLDKLERRQKVDRMLDSYDRTLLLLQYSCQFINDIASSLEEATVRQNAYVGVGGSSAGIVSGVLGIAAAATILTPAGPPLLLASLLFGGGATAVQTGAEVKNRYFSEPDKLADRIIALHAMLEAIVRIIGMLRDALLGDEFCRSKMKENDHDHTTNFTAFLSKAYEKNKSGILVGVTAGRLGMVGMEIGGQLTAEMGTLAGSARFFSRSASNVLRTARLARFAGGALSAATLVLEAKCMTRTIADIRAGNPCEKAQQLRAICAQLDFPSSACLDSECERYLQAMNQRERRMTQEEAVRLLLETAPPAPVAEELPVLEGDEDQLILACIPDHDDDVESGEANTTISTEATIVRPPSSNTSIAGTCKKNEKMDMSASLLERIARFKRQEDTMASKNATTVDASRKMSTETVKKTSSSVSSSSSSNAALSSARSTASVPNKSPPLPSGDTKIINDSSLSASLLQRIEMFKLRQTGGGQEDGSNGTL